MIKSVYVKDSRSLSQVFERYSRFSAGRDSAEDDNKSGRSRSSRNEENVEPVP